MDELADAMTALLVLGGTPQRPLDQPLSALGARDTVVQQLRTLVGAVGEVPRFNEVRALTLTEVVDRPAQALHAALSELPRALPFGSAELVFDAAPELSPYEQAWQRAAGASLGLEVYVDVLHQLPDSTAWHVLRDLTDAAAALPYLDHDLSEAVRLTRTSAAQVQEAYRQLIHPGHHAVRIVTADVRARVPAPPNRSAAPPHRHMQMAASPEPTASAAAEDGSPLSAAAAQQGTTVRPGSVAAVTVTEQMARCAHAISARGAHLSIIDVKAVRRLVELGARSAAAVLERAAPVLPGATDVAQELRETAAAAAALRSVPARSMTPPHLDLIATSRDALTEITALAGQCDRLPPASSPQDLRRLAAVALAVAEHVPALTTALDLSIREALANKVMLVPGTTGDDRTSAVSWVTVSMGAPQEPPAVAAAAGHLATTARRLPPSVHQARQELSRHAVTGPTATQQALLDARRHAGAAREDLRHALTHRTSTQPDVLRPTLPAHPRLFSQPSPSRRT
jgi:hypothetical protein